MKPDWKDAPEWANWLAMDKDGIWFWYEKEPYKSNHYSVQFDTGGKLERAEIADWESTKEKRP